MKAVFIDSNTDFINAVAENLGLPEGNTTTLSKDVAAAKDVRTLAESIVIGYKDAISSQAYSELLFFINLDLVLNESYKPFLGVELLTWLRIKGIMSHCVLYSFCDASTIAGKDRQNLILFSKGTTLIQLPYDFSQLKSKIVNLSTEIANNNNLESYLKASFNLGAFRHREANWWGMKQTLDVHALTDMKSIDDALPTPNYDRTSVSKELKSLNNAVAAYLHRLDTKHFWKYRQECALRLKDTRTKRDQAKGHADAKNGEAERIKAESTQAIEAFQAELDLLTAELTNPPDKSSDVYTLQARQVRVSEIQEKIGTLRELIEVANSEARSASLDADQLNKSVKDMEESFWNVERESLGIEARQPNKCNIVLIDDQAKSGWKCVFGEVLRPRHIVDVFDGLVIDRNAEDDEKVEKVFNASVSSIDRLLNGSVPLLVFLDLRLFDEVGRVAPSKLTGLQLLKRLRKKYPALHIMVISASNKREVFEEVIRSGADAYWEKEGLDQHFDFTSSVDSYNRLILLVNRLSGQEYKQLREFTQFASGLRQVAYEHPNVWWIHSTDDLAETLLDAANMYRAFLHSSHLRYGANVGSDAFVLSGLINKVCGVYENVHPDYDYEAETWGNFLNRKHDYYAKKLKRARDEFSHAGYRVNGYSPTATFSQAIRTVEEYLSMADNRPVHTPPDVLST
ncbi:MAG: hypothetical protein IPM59_09355 [Chloracidobacterium sp.]|nr:hypothetical protein [Chloracidobacterium sp.]